MNNRLSLTTQTGYHIGTNYQQYVNTVAKALWNGDQNEYIVGKIDQKTLYMTVRLEYYVSPELSFQYYGSPYASIGKYDDFRRVTNASSRDLNQRYAPVTVVNEVANNYSMDNNGDHFPDFQMRKPDFNFQEFRSNLVGRWEFSPGSTLYLVWTNTRSLYENNYNSSIGNSFGGISDLKTTIKPDAHDRYHKYLELGEEKGEFDFFTKSEERKIAYYHAVRIKSDFNLSMLINITNQKKTEQDLLIAKLHAEESDRLKSAFLANMSHEIRTPMNGILGFAELLKEPDLTGEQQQEYIKIIEKSGARMLNIINDIVDISKIESGLMKLAINETNVNEQIEYIYTFFKPEVESKGIRLAFRNALPAKEAILKTDREKVYAILTNLVKNAIKYTDKGSIEFGYSVVVDAGHALSIPQKSFLQFYVKDTGIGIPKDRQDAIFERFIQADMADVQARQGAGLGLAISKSYVELLGGKIWVEGEMGLGSTFYFSLPFNAETVIETINQQFAPSAITEPIRKLKILIAEDDEVSEMLIDITAKTLGKEILKVRSGVQAVEACRDNPDIDLILMDIRMPEMGGYEATQKIREFNKDVVIIAQTAYGLSGDREKAIEAGCNDYISKPINKEKLLSIIHKNFNE